MDGNNESPNAMEHMDYSKDKSYHDSDKHSILGSPKMTQPEYDVYHERHELNKELENNQGDYSMSGSINPNDVATLSLLGGGYGGGYGLGNRGYGQDTREAFDGTVSNAKIDLHHLAMNRENEFSRDTIREENSRTRELMDERANDARIEALRTQGASFQIQTQRDLADARAETAKCCCETKTLILAENTKTRELLQSNIIADLERQLSVSRIDSGHASLAQQMALQTQILQGMSPHCPA